MSSRLCDNNHNITVTPQCSSQLPSIASTLASPSSSFTNTAKLPIDTVKRLIAAVSRRPHLWIRNNQNGQKRSDINFLWYEVGQEVHLPADICRIKWGHLRDNFRKVLIRNTFSDETPTSWRFYNDMRFMEKAVTENIIRQQRIKARGSHWLDMPQDATLYSTAKIFQSFDRNTISSTQKLHDGNYDHDMQQRQQQFNYSEVSMFLNQTQPFKRIKLEAQTSIEHSPKHMLELVNHQRNNFEHKMVPLNSDKDQHLNVDAFNPLNGSQLMSNSVNDEDHVGDDADDDADEDDDEFDEDTATTEEPDYDAKKHHTVKSRDDIYTIELFDDDDDEVENNEQQQPNANAMTENEVQRLTCDASTNTEDSNMTGKQEQNADRMFLLSLMPYLKNVDGQRKLMVRQKLQQVLIDEFG